MAATTLHRSGVFVGWRLSFGRRAINLWAGLFRTDHATLEHIAGLPDGTAASQARAGPSRAGTTSAGNDVSRRFAAEILPHLDAANTLARYLARDQTAAEDIVQDAFLRAFRAFESFRGEKSRAWLLAIVRNCHRDWRAQQMRASKDRWEPGSPDDKSEDDPIAAVASPELTPEEALLKRDEASRVRAILMALQEDFREVLVLRDLEDCSYIEIAEITGTPLGTVMSRLARARRLFGRIWVS